MIPKFRPLTKIPSPPPANLDISSHNEAVLLVQSGGRVIYLNQTARELFNLWEEEPNLESLARRTRPSETFLTLCAAEGQARFSLNGRALEGTSYFTSSVPDSNGNEQHSAILVSLRRPQLTVESEARLASSATDLGPKNAGAAVQSAASGQAFSVFAELSQKMSSSLELNVALQAILESVERLVPSDFMEITLWDSDSEMLVPYRLIGISGVDRHLEKGSERYRPDQGYTGHLISTRQPLIVKDVSTFRQARPALDRQRYPFQSYIGLPILVAGELVGTLEMASLLKENYSESDLEIISLLSGQAAVALKNALLYEQEQQRAVELAGLANLAQTVSVIRDPQDLYAHLVESISPLLKVEILGFLVYDENRHALEGQVPFQGIPDNLIEWYRTTIQPSSVAETIWQSAETISTSVGPEDPRLQALELHNLAQTASIRNTVLSPLTTGGRMLGYLQVANKRDGSAFDKNDLRLLAIIAGQSAPIIENAALVQQSRRRAQRAETLRRIASLTSSAATLDEILKFSILDLSRLLQADTAALFLLDESRGELRIHKNSVFGVPPEISARIGRILIDDPQFSLTVTGSKRQFVNDDLSEGVSPLSLYQPFVEGLQVRSVIDVPLIARERSIGELMVGNFRPNFFSRGDTQTVATAAGQLAAAIEQSALSSQTDESLRQRVEQLTALTSISRELNTTLVLPHLLRRVYEEVLRTTRADCGTVLLLDLRLFDLSEIMTAPSEQEESTVQAMTPTQNSKILLHFGDPPGPELHPLEQLVLDRSETVIVSEFQSPASDENDQEDSEGKVASTPPHPAREGSDNLGWQVRPAHKGVRSSIVIPIAYQGQVAGLIHLHSRQPNHFGETEREIGESLAIQAAIAMGNAQRYQEQMRRNDLLNRRVETLSKLSEVSQVLQSEQPLEQSLEAIAYALQASTPFDVVLISVYNSQNNQLVRVTGTGIPLATMAEMRARPQPWNSVKKLFRPENLLGRCYFIPSEQAPEIPADLHIVNLSTEQPALDSQSWKPDDMLLLPLFTAEQEPLGLISVDVPRNNRRPDSPTIETLEIFGSQAALIIETQQKVRFLRSRVQEIETELTFAREVAQTAQNHLPVLLHKDLEQTLIIQNLHQRSQRINAGLDIAEIVNKQTSHADVLLALAHETMTQMDFDTVLVAEQAPGGLNLLHTLGAIPSGVNPKALLGQRNPLRQCLQAGTSLFVPDLDQNPDWQNAPLLRSLEAKGFVCLPIARTDKPSTAPQLTSPAEEEPTAAQLAMLAISKTHLATFTSDDEQLFDLLTRQTSIALQNLNLLDETKRRLGEVNLLLDFGRQLGSLDPASILQSLVETTLRVIPTAQSALVALWDATQNLLIPQAAAGYVNNSALMGIAYHPGEGVPGQVFEQRQAMRLDEIDFAKHYNLQPENLGHYRNATGGRLPVSCLAVPIIAASSQQTEASAPEQLNGQGKTAQRTEDARAVPLGVLILDNAQNTAAFTEADQDVIASLARQTALTLENASLYQASEQRSQQLQALTDVTTTVTSSLHPEQLVATLLEQLQAIIPYDTGTLWLRQREETFRVGVSKADKLVVRAARGFEDSDQRIGLAVDVQDSQLLNEMISTGRPIWVANVAHDPRFRALAMDEAEAEEVVHEHLSWLGVPLIASGEVIGVIALEKVEPNFYTPADIQVATTFAGQAAIGLENAKLYQESVTRAGELDQRSQMLTILNRLSSELSSSLDAQNILNVSLQELSQVIPCSSVSAVLFENTSLGDIAPEEADQTEIIASRILLKAEYTLVDLDEDTGYVPGARLPNVPLLERLRETQGIFSTEDVKQEAELEPLHDFLERYHTRSLLVVPITAGGAPGSESGMLLIHNDQPYRYHSEEFALARTISNQVAIALQNARLFEETHSLTEDLEMRVQQRTSEFMREQHRVETLLRIITELSASLDLDQVLHRTLEVLNEYVDAEQITILVARPGERQFSRLASLGYPADMTSASDKSKLNVDEGLAGWILGQRQSVIINDVQKDERWIRLKYDSGEWTGNFKHQSALGVPLMSGADALGCLLLFHPLPSHFSMDQLDLIQAAANQVAVAVNNAELYNLIRDQAEDLGTMLRSQQVETSRTKAILEAVADGILVTDAHRQITLFNESAENILELNRTEVLGKSMEKFIGLFGRAAQSWMEIIETWSEDPSAYQAGDVYAEQFTLEDGRVISVHLAPVSLKTDFLGTVSIFRDITHQVEVDRLKSEFVATVSHELRTPMTSIKGYVEILLMGAAGALSDQQNHFLQVVKTNTERLIVLVNDLLDVSKIEAGRAALSMQSMDLEELINRAIESLERRIQEDHKSVTIEKDVQPDLPSILGDPARVLQIIENLVDNAYLYNKPDGQIMIRVYKVEDEIQVDVKDTGIGVHPADAPRLFERFFRGESPLTLGVSGTGLGLSIVKNLVEMHNGRIWVQSLGLPGEGSTFSFTLPVYKPE